MAVGLRTLSYLMIFVEDIIELHLAKPLQAGPHCILIGFFAKIYEVATYLGVFEGITHFGTS